MCFVMVGVNFAIHQVFNLVGVEVACDHHAQIVGDELHHMVVMGQVWVFVEQTRVVRVFHILLDGHQAIFASFLQDVVQQGEQ